MNVVRENIKPEKLVNHQINRTVNVDRITIKEINLLLNYGLSNKHLTESQFVKIWIYQFSPYLTFRGYNPAELGSGKRLRSG